MAEVVFILGAGASKSGGVPLMGEFLDAADKLEKRGDLPEEDSEKIRKVFEGIAALQDVHSKADLEINNIESVFAAFEMAKTLGGFAGYSPEDMDKLLVALRRLIVVTIESYLEFPAYTDSSSVVMFGNSGAGEYIEVKPPSPYPSFVERVKDVRQEYSPKRTVGLLTFNYDLALDYALYYEGISIDYGLENHYVERESIPVLKLHGSLNWAKGEVSSGIYPWMLGDFLDGEWRKLKSHTPFSLPLGSKIGDYQLADEDAEDEPVLVPPTWNKAEYQNQLQSVWSRASDELEEAEHIFCIGFSLNPTDSFFRYLYGLGTVGGRPLKNFFVVDPAVDRIQDRYLEMLGPAAERAFRPVKGTFEDALEIIESELS